MKKYLIIGLSIISSLFFVSNVKAETKEFEYGIFDSENYVIGTGILIILKNMIIFHLI